jgi:hypothetical protein
MWDMLVTHENQQRGSDNFGELPLACGIEAAFGRITHDWLKVPEKLREPVLDYIARLNKEQEGAAA